MVRRRPQFTAGEYRIKFTFVLESIKKGFSEYSGKIPPKPLIQEKEAVDTSAHQRRVQHRWRLLLVRLGETPIKPFFLMEFFTRFRLNA